MDVLHLTAQEFQKRLKAHIEKIYGKTDSELILKNILAIFADMQPAYENADDQSHTKQLKEEWGQKDIYLITYGNSILSDERMPLEVLLEFLNKYLKGVVTTVHVLPFFPYSSDDGFAVIDYKQVNPDLGDWQDIKNLSKHFDLMADLVINHISNNLHP